MLDKVIPASKAARLNVAPNSGPTGICTAPFSTTGS